jgi:hypothetical protein
LRFFVALVRLVLAAVREERRERAQPRRQPVSRLRAHGDQTETRGARRAAAADDFVVPFHLCPSLWLGEQA